MFAAGVLFDHIAGVSFKALTGSLGFGNQPIEDNLADDQHKDHASDANGKTMV